MQHGMPTHLHQTFWCAAKAVEFIRRYQGYHRPWLFSVNIFDPHFNCDPPDEYFDRYLDRLDEIPLPDFQPGELDAKPYYHEKKHAPWKYGQSHGGGDGGGRPKERPEGDPRRHRALRAGYWAMCDFIDVQVGRMLDALEETGQLDETIVIFTSEPRRAAGRPRHVHQGPAALRTARSACR